MIDEWIEENIEQLYNNFMNSSQKEINVSSKTKKTLIRSGTIETDQRKL